MEKAELLAYNDSPSPASRRGGLLDLFNLALMNYMEAAVQSPVSPEIKNMDPVPRYPADYQAVEGSSLWATN